MAGKGQLNTFLDDLMQYVPADQRAAAQSIYSKAADRAATLEGTAQQVAETAQQQHAWWERNKNVVEERDTLAARLAANNPNPNPNPNPGGSPVDMNAITQAIKASEAATLETGLGLVTTITTIAAQHQAEFGEPLNATQLTKDAIAAGVPIEQFYANSVAGRRNEKAQATRAAELAAAKAEGIEAGRQEVLARIPNGQLPFPVAGQPAVTTLAGLKKPGQGEPNPFSLDAAVATLNAEMAGRQ